MIYPEIEDISTQWDNAQEFLRREVISRLTGIEKDVAKRSVSASNQLRNASQIVLRGERSGRRYKLPTIEGHYNASAPGEAPANRLGSFRNSWGTKIHISRTGNTLEANAGIESPMMVGGRYVLGEILENGTRRMAPRPYKQQILNMAMPRIVAIYNRPY